MTGKITLEALKAHLNDPKFKKRIFPTLDSLIYSNHQHYDPVRRIRTFWTKDKNGNYVANEYVEYGNDYLRPNYYYPSIKPITIDFTDVDVEVARLLTGTQKEQTPAEPKDPSKVRGPSHCNHGFHRPCEVCEPELHSTWIKALGGPG